MVWLLGVRTRLIKSLVTSERGVIGYGIRILRPPDVALGMRPCFTDAGAVHYVLQSQEVVRSEDELFPCPGSGCPICAMMASNGSGG